jgi:hypothetical protein
VADARELRHELAHGLVRARGAARRGGDDHPRAVSVAHRVVVYHAVDCSLCARAVEVVEAARDELAFDLETIDIGGDLDLEARYRAVLPVVEIDGVRAFTYFVDPEALRARLRD